MMNRGQIFDLAKRIGEADYVILRVSSSDGVGNTEFRDDHLSGDDHNLIVDVLREKQNGAFEHKHIYIGPPNQSFAQDQINAAGREGWELVQIIGLDAWMKRGIR